VDWIQADEIGATQPATAGGQLAPIAIAEIEQQVEFLMSR
jgi:hypothetical protein